jgi:hypothetical protein
MPSCIPNNFLTFISGFVVAVTGMQTLKGGDSSLIEWWGKNGIPGPVLLVNQDNCRILDDAAENGNPTTSAKELSHSAMTCGGIKAADIAGAIFHHKDDKKGQRRTFTF